MNITKHQIIVTLVAIGAVILGVVVIYFSAKDAQAFREECENELGGYTDTKSQTNTTTGYHTVNGKQEFGTYTTTTSTTYCFGKNGEGILDVR